MTSPGFIDNRYGNTLASALSVVLGMPGPHSTAGEGAPDQVRIATAFFSPTGFGLIADHLARIPDVRLLLGADLAINAPESHKLLNETPDGFERRRITEGLKRHDQRA